MNSTDPVVYLGQALKQNSVLRDQLERVRGHLHVHIGHIQREINRIQDALRVRYTGWTVLLKKEDDRWICVGVVNSSNLPEDIPEDFDVALPIPDPETIPDFDGW